MADERIAAGIDLGGTKIHSVIAAADGRVLGEDRRLTEPREGVDAVIGRMAASVRGALAEAGLGIERLAGAGISSPGPCDIERGVVTDAPNLFGWHEVPVVRLVGEALGVPALLENDAAAAAYGEFRFGAGRGRRHIVYVTVSTGIGGGVIIDGRLYRGASGAAGEVGHLVLDDDGPACNCGSRGCLEAIASGTAIARDAATAIAEGRSALMAELARAGPLNAELVRDAADRGDEAAQAIIGHAGYFLGLGLTGLLNCFNPEVLIIGGGLTGLGDRYLGHAIRTARERAFPQMVADVTIATAALGERSGALGVAALLLDSAAR